MSTKGKKLPSRSREIIIDEETEQVILGSILGDGTISKYRRSENSSLNMNSKLSIKHSIIQEDYILYKKYLLDRNNIINHLYYRKASNKKNFINGREIKDNGSITLDTGKSISINKYRDLFYNNCKFIPEYVYNLKELGLAIWFMDDGSKHISGYYLHTNSFNYEDHIKLQNVLKLNFDINTSIHSASRNSYNLYIRKNSIEKFDNLILPYICDSMKYKLHSGSKLRESGKVLIG